MASIHKRGSADGGYFYEVDFGFRGQRFRRSCKTGDLKLAKAIRDDISARISRGTFRLEEMTEHDIAIGEFADLYLTTHSEIEKADGTVDIDRRALNRFKGFVGQKIVHPALV